MSAAQILLRLAPPELDPALWSAALDLAGAGSLGARRWDLSVIWEETPAPFAAVAEFFREEQTAFPRLPLGDMSWALDAEERYAGRFRIGLKGAERLGEDEEPRAPWLALYLVTASARPDRAVVGTVRRGISTHADDAVGRALAPLEQVPLLGETAVSLAQDLVDRERSAVLVRERDDTWTIEEPIRGC